MCHFLFQEQIQDFSIHDTKGDMPKIIKYFEFDQRYFEFDRQQKVQKEIQKATKEAFPNVSVKDVESAILIRNPIAGDADFECSINRFAFKIKQHSRSVAKQIISKVPENCELVKLVKCSEDDCFLKIFVEKSMPQSNSDKKLEQVSPDVEIKVNISSLGKSKLNINF